MSGSRQQLSRRVVSMLIYPYVVVCECVFALEVSWISWRDRTDVAPLELRGCVERSGGIVEVGRFRGPFTL